MATPLASLSKEKIRPLLQLNDKLRKLSALEKDINVTSIVVVGDQSHGKTSVVEALSGIDLPRGEGIQTRVPLFLMLRNVYRKEQDDLTLIDLPGMTRVPTQGQPENIEETITKMYDEYMRPPETVLLNVVSCMVDFCTSKSLQMSRKLDPDGQRTLLCVTKIDQHKEGGLKGRLDKASEFRCPLFCVRNRTQAENNEKMTLATVRQKEEKLLEEHDELKHFPSEVKGVRALSTRLVALQEERIREAMPEVSTKIMKRKQDLEDKLSRFGTQPKNEGEAKLLLTRLTDDTVNSLRQELNGRSSSYSNEGQNLIGNHATIQLKVAPGSSYDCELARNKLTLTFTSDNNGILQATMGLPSNVSEVTLQFDFKLLDAPHGLLASATRQLVKKVTVQHGMPTQLVTSLALGCTYSIDMVVTDVKSSGSSTNKLLCARLTEIDDEFTLAIQNLHPDKFLFSDCLRQRIRMEYQGRRGASGMPDSLPPEVPLATLKFLREPLPGHAHDLVSEVKEAVSSAVARVVGTHFRDYPRAVSRGQAGRSESSQQRRSAALRSAD